MESVLQITELAKALGLPAGSTGEEITAALEKAAKKDNKAALALVQKHISIPSDIPDWLGEAIKAIRKYGGALTNAKTALADAILDGRLKADGDHSKIFRGLIENRETTEVLLNSIRTTRNPAESAALEFPARVKAEQAAGLSRSASVDAVMKSHPDSHRRWLAAGGGPI